MRRGHGSTKVPGVKLRPAALTKSGRLGGDSSQQSIWAQLSNTEEVDSTEILRSCKKPFVRVVVCGSGLSDKVNLFQQAIQLGAQTSSDLTDRVTHLICEIPGSAKYKYCVEHGIPILQPSWITEAYGKWISGEAVDVVKSANIHRFPTFKTVRLCLTGINETQRRKRIRRQLEQNGGSFVEALGKDAEVTHLLCGPDRGENKDQNGVTSKMQFIMKANKSRSERVHLVWEDWFWDCLEFKGILTESEYPATGPRPPRRLRREPSQLMEPIASTAEQKQQRESTVTSPLGDNVDAEEIAKIKRVPEAAALLCESMLRKRGFEVKDGKLTRSPSKTHAPKNPAADDSRLSPSLFLSNGMEGQLSSHTGSSLNAAFKRTKSFAAKVTDLDVPKSAFQRIRSTPATVLRQASSAVVAASAPPNKNVELPEGERNLFAGLRFRALGEASGPKLTEALELRGGKVVTESNNTVDFIIVRLVGGSTFYHDEPREVERSKLRTECWIEQCIFEERLCASEEHPAFVPLRITTPITDADKLVLHISGLIPSEKTPSVRLIKAIGAAVTDQLSRRNTHLICPCGSGPKFDKAQEWKIPVLNLQWLFSTVKSGTIQNVNDYLVSSPVIFTPAPVAATGIREVTMTDITNSEFVQGSSRAKNSGKGSDKSQSSNSSSAAAASRAEIEAAFSDCWTADALPSESGPEHPPTSSPALSSRSLGSHPTTPSPVRRHATDGDMMLRAPVASPFTSPTKSKKSAGKDLERVPSSATPSPMRMPSKNTRTIEQEGTAITPSPATAIASTLSSESASTLKDAIASLLGKRPSSDDAEGDSQNQDQAQAVSAQQAQQQQHQQGPSTRASKRSKPPPRTKSRQDGSGSGRAFSRTASSEVLGRTGSTLSAAGSAYPFDFPLASGNEMVDSASEMNEPGSRVMEEVDESMRVTYEDPSQRAEERRLLSLISGGVVDAEAEQMTTGPTKDEAQIVAEETTQEAKKPQPKPRRRGRNLVRRVTNVTEQS